MASNEAIVSSRVKWSTFVGIHLVRFFCGVPWVWGNMSIYVSSYFYSKNRSDAYIATDPWLPVSNNLGFNIFILVGSFIGRKIGTLTSIFLAMMTYNGSVFISYFSVQHSYWALCVTFGLIPGICAGIIEANQYPLIVRWTERYQGISTSSVPSFNIFGAVILNLLVTFYINPENKEADVSTNHAKMFSEKELINRVPYVFFLYSGLSLVLNCTGFLLLRHEPGDDCVAMKIFTKLKNILFVLDPAEKERIIRRQAFEMKTECSTEFENDVPGNSSEENPDLTPIQVLKTKEFYALWIMMPILNYMFVVVNNFYKTFGILHIPDDHFLASVGTLNCLLSPPCTFLAGYVMDRTGVKNTMLGITGLLCVVASFFYVTPFLDKWLFLVCSVAYSCLIITAFCSMCSCCLKLFGETYFNTIFGMVLSLACIVSVTTPYIVKVILTHGWLVFFYTLAGLTFIMFNLALFGLPKRTRFKTL